MSADFQHTINRYKLTGIIYYIRNVVENKIYIGRSNYSFNRRYRSGQWWKYTHNEYLKQDYDRLGHSAFSVEIIHHGCDRKTLAQLETSLIVTHDCLYPKGYNLMVVSPSYAEISISTRQKMMIAGKARAKREPNPFLGKKHSKQSLQLMSQSHKGARFTEEQKQHKRDITPRGAFSPRSVPDLQIDSTTKVVINEFANIKIAAQIMKVTPSAIGRACRCDHTKSCDYIWRYKNGSSPRFDDGPRIHKGIRQVKQIDPQTGRTIAEFESMKLAAIAVRVPPSGITKACKGYSKTSGGFIWQYKNIP